MLYLFVILICYTFMVVFRRFLAIPLSRLKLDPESVCLKRVSHPNSRGRFFCLFTRFLRFFIFANGCTGRTPFCGERQSMGAGWRGLSWLSLLRTVLSWLAFKELSALSGWRGLSWPSWPSRALLALLALIAGSREPTVRALVRRESFGLLCPR